MNVAQHILSLGIRFYRWGLSPVKTVLFGAAGRCRFEPSCSAYALQAVSMHGATKGTVLAVKRLCRCHPWGAFGPDAVPQKVSPTSWGWLHACLGRWPWRGRLNSIADPRRLDTTRAAKKRSEPPHVVSYDGRVHSIRSH